MDSRVTKDVIEGFELDFNDIVDDFSSTHQDLEFTNFLKYWNEKHFDCLFANRYDPRELLEAISDMNIKLVQTLTDSSSQRDEEKIIALYFLLCLYVKQPHRLRRKIRLTCSDLIFIQNFTRDESLRGPKQDIRFVWKSLRAMQAIDYVESRIMFGPSLLTNRGGKRELEFDICQQSEANEEYQEACEFIRNKIDPELSEMEMLCNSYEQIRDSLNIDNYQDSSSVEQLNSTGTFRDFIDKARALTEQFGKEKFK